MRVVGSDVPVIGGRPPGTGTRRIATESEVEDIGVGVDDCLRRGERPSWVCHGAQNVAADPPKRRLRVEGIVVRGLVPAEGQVVGARLVNIEAKRCLLYT